MSQIYRVIRMGGQNIFRNSFLSFASIFISTIVLFVIGLFLFLYIALDDTIEIVKDKVNITVYFVNGTPEAQIMEIQDQLDGLPAVKEVIYTSEEEVLEEYKIRHINDAELLSGLSILGENPFRARISIKAQDNKQLTNINEFLENQDSQSDNELLVIDKIDYSENESTIQRLLSLIDIVVLVSTVLTVLLLFVSFLIIYTTILLVISASATEIDVMQLMGASHNYIRGPFILSGIVYGFVGSLLAILFVYPTVLWAESLLREVLLVGGNTIIFSTNEIIFSLILIIAIGVVVGAVSSFFSTEKYLK